MYLIINQTHLPIIHSDSLTSVVTFIFKEYGTFVQTKLKLGAWKGVGSGFCLAFQAQVQSPGLCKEALYPHKSNIDQVPSHICGAFP